MIHHGRHHHQPVRPRFRRRPRRVFRFARPGLIDRHQHRQFACRGLGGLHHGELLIKVQHRPFAKRAGDNNPVNARLGLQPETPLHLAVIQCSHPP